MLILCWSHTFSGQNKLEKKVNNYFLKDMKGFLTAKLGAVERLTTTIKIVWKITAIKSI